MFGQLQLEHFDGLNKLPQKAASAWSAVFNGELVGATFKPILYLGQQVVHGVNYYFIAEETLVVRGDCRRIVKLVIHELGDTYTLLEGSIETIAA